MTKKAQAHARVRNPLETETVKQMGDTLKNDVIKGGVDNFFNQLLGFSFKGAEPSHETIKQGTKQIEHLDPKKGAVELFNAKTHGRAESHPKKSAEKPRVRRTEAAPAIDYHGDIVRSSERTSRREVGELSQRIEQITVELKRLISSSKVLQMEFATVSVEQTGTTVGEYHANFLEWMLIVIKNAREKVEDSGAWLSTVKGKNGKKSAGYWDMFKKHGTSFGLSSERNVATQTG